MIISVIIPVFNERTTILEIIKRVKSVNGFDIEIIVVDDASSDGTAEILKKLKDRKIKTIYLDRNSGKGAALKKGFKESTGDYVIVQDADLEYDPNDIPKLINALEGKNTVVYGSRFSSSFTRGYSTHILGNRILTIITNKLFNTNLTDMETCYKLIPGKFARSVKIESNKFNFEPEITAKILKSGLKIKEVSIRYQGRTFSEGKKITWKDGFSALYTLLKYRFLK